MWTLVMTVGLSACLASAELEALRERLVSTVEAGDVVALKAILSKQPRYVEARSAGRTLLHLAAGHENPELTRLLLEHGANVHVSGPFGEGPLHLAANREIAALLLKAGAAINAIDGNGSTPLDMAFQRQDEALAEFLLDQGADPKASRNKTPTLVAAIWSAPRLATRIIELGVDVQSRGYDGQMPILHIAIQAMHVEAVRMMLQRGAGIRSRTNDGSAAIHWLAGAWSETRERPGFQEARMRMAQLLLEQGADINAQDKEGATVLHLLAKDPDSGPLVRFLIRHKADFRARDHQGQAPLHRAVTAGVVPLVSVLLDAGTRADALDNEGQTSLHLAIEAMTGWHNTGPPGMNSIGPLVRVPRPSPEHEQIVSLLLRAGADPHRKDKRGRTPLGMAREIGLHRVVELLTAHRSDRRP